MKRALIPAFLLLLGSTMLGATVLREPVARAAAPIASVFVTNDASSPVPVREQNLDADGNVKVHEQGTANVNVTNSSLSVAPLAPVTGGGFSYSLNGGSDNVFSIPKTATALSIRLDSGVQVLGFSYQGSVVGSFFGPALRGNDSIVLALTRPITFDELSCTGPGTDRCVVSWIGAEP